MRLGLRQVVRGVFHLGLIVSNCAALKIVVLVSTFAGSTSVLLLLHYGEAYELSVVCRAWSINSVIRPRVTYIV